ncbi:MAG: hypothetical protein ACYCPQ_04320 [Elusimicrobiota bacterium]
MKTMRVLQFITLAAVSFSLMAQGLQAQSVDWNNADPITGMHAVQSLLKKAGTQLTGRQTASQARTLPYGRLDASPEIFTAPVKTNSWTYPSDGIESKTFIINSACDPGSAMAGWTSQPYCRARLSMSYRWIPKTCIGASANANPDCGKAAIHKNFDFPELRVDQKNGVVLLPKWGYPASVQNTIVAKITNDPAFPHQRVVLQKGYSLHFRMSTDSGDEAYLHCRYSEGIGWVDCDNSPGVKTIVTQVYLDGPGLDPACDSSEEIANPSPACSRLNLAP